MILRPSDGHQDPSHFFVSPSGTLKIWLCKQEMRSAEVIGLEQKITDNTAAKYQGMKYFDWILSVKK